MAQPSLTREALADLSHPFDPESFSWQKAEEELEHARFERVLSRRALFERLDDVLEGEWHYALEVVSPMPPVVVVTLELAGVRRSGLGEGLSLRDAEAVALSQAALAYGIAQDELEGASRWERSDWNPEEGRSSGLARAALERSSDAPPAPQPDPEPEKPEAHRFIDDIFEKLKEAGLGHEGNKIMMRYGGYGKTLEDSRALYKELNALLKKGKA